MWALPLRCLEGGSTSILRKVADYGNLSIFYPKVIGYPIPGEFAVTSLSIAKLFSF